MNIVTGGQVKPVKGVWKYRQRKKRAGKAAKTEPTIRIPDAFKPIIREELTHYAKDFACGRKEFVLNEMRRRVKTWKEGRAERDSAGSSAVSSRKRSSGVSSELSKSFLRGESDNVFVLNQTAKTLRGNTDPAITVALAVTLVVEVALMIWVIIEFRK